MLYINNGSTISDQPKRDSSNNADTIITLDANDANTKMAYASTRRAQLKLNVESPYTDNTHYTDGWPWADNYHRTLTPRERWGVAGDYTFPSHPGWLVVRDGVLFIDGGYTIRQCSIDQLRDGIDSIANPGLYSGNYWLFNSGAAWDASRSNLTAAWCMNGGGGLVNTPIYDVGYGQAHILPAGGPGPASFTTTKREPPYYPAYPVGLTTENISTRTGSTSYSGAWSTTDPYDCQWALEYIFMPLSSSVGGEQTWGSYDFADLTTPGYRFYADSGNTSIGYYVSGRWYSNGYATKGTLGSGFRNAMAWRLLWRPEWNDTRSCTSYAQVTMNVSRTNTDGSQFSAGDGGWSGDITGQNFLARQLHQTS